MLLLQRYLEFFIVTVCLLNSVISVVFFKKGNVASGQRLYLVHPTLIKCVRIHRPSFVCIMSSRRTLNTQLVRFTDFHCPHGV